jgi:hypothetical protein
MEPQKEITIMNQVKTIRIISYPGILLKLSVIKTLPFLFLFITSLIQAQTKKDICNPQVPVVFFGIDFTKVLFTRSDEFTNKPEILRFFVDVNNMINHGSLRNLVDRGLDMKKIEWDFSYVTTRNSMVNWQSVYSDQIDYTVPEEEMKNILRNLNIDQEKYRDFIGMILIEENCCKTKPLQTVSCVFFNVNDLNILYSKRYELKPGGIGFMNYWGVNHNLILSKIGKIKKELM